MAWTYNSVRIYAQESDEGTSQIAPRLQPISGGSVIQSFGYDSTVRNISAIVVGDTNKDALKALAQDGMSSHALVSPEGSLGNWMLKSFKANRTKSTCQTIDEAQAEDAPVYDCQLELWQED
jgi:hypothetical protein